MLIKMYNMVDYASEKANLVKSAYIGDVNLIAVKLSLPNGNVTFDYTTKEPITHISFNAYGLNIIAKIVSYSAVSNNLINFIYTVDYIKTFFANVKDSDLFYVKSSTEGSMVVRNADNRIYSNVMQINSRKYSDIFSYDIVAVMRDGYVNLTELLPTGVFVFGGDSASKSLRALQKRLLSTGLSDELLSSVKGNQILSQIQGVYIVPKVSETLKIESGLLSYTDTDTFGQYKTSTIDDCYGTWLTNVDDTIKNFTKIDTKINVLEKPLAVNPQYEYTIYIPLLGEFNINTNYIDYGDTLTIYYRLDYISGVIQWYYNKCPYTYQTNLPTLPLATTDKSNILQDITNKYKIAQALVTNTTSAGITYHYMPFNNLGLLLFNDIILRVSRRFGDVDIAYRNTYGTPFESVVSKDFFKTGQKYTIDSRYISVPPILEPVKDELENGFIY